MDPPVLLFPSGKRGRKSRHLLAAGPHKGPGGAPMPAARSPPRRGHGAEAGGSNEQFHNGAFKSGWAELHFPVPLIQ